MSDITGVSGNVNQLQTSQSARNLVTVNSRELMDAIKKKMNSLGLSYVINIQDKTIRFDEGPNSKTYAFNQTQWDEITQHRIELSNQSKRKEEYIQGIVNIDKYRAITARDNLRKFLITLDAEDKLLPDVSNINLQGTYTSAILAGKGFNAYVFLDQNGAEILSIYDTMFDTPEGEDMYDITIKYNGSTYNGAGTLSSVNNRGLTDILKLVAQKEVELAGKEILRLPDNERKLPPVTIE